MLKPLSHLTVLYSQHNVASTSRTYFYERMPLDGRRWRASEAPCGFLEATYQADTFGEGDLGLISL